ncbi:aspartate aminotransferase, partial [Cystoisospora suis]
MTFMATRPLSLSSSSSFLDLSSPATAIVRLPTSGFPRNNSSLSSSSSFSNFSSPALRFLSFLSSFHSLSSSSFSSSSSLHLSTTSSLYTPSVSPDISRSLPPATISFHRRLKKPSLSQIPSFLNSSHPFNGYLSHSFSSSAKHSSSFLRDRLTRSGREGGVQAPFLSTGVETPHSSLLFSHPCRTYQNTTSPKMKSEGGNSIFQEIVEAPADPILGLQIEYTADTNPKKVNLGIGAYRTEEGLPYVLKCVREIEKEMAGDTSLSKEYLPIDGMKELKKPSQELLFGEESEAIKSDRICSVQGLSGTGSLRVAGEFIHTFLPEAS